MGDPLVVAVDGPGGSGKSTVARAVARRLGLRYLDTGAMYRAVTWLALERRLDVEDGEALAELTERAALTVGTDPDAPAICVEGADVSAEIRSRPVTSAVSAVSAVPAVRKLLVDQQRAIIAAAPRGIVVEGRDIGTVVSPDASVKVFLTASTAERAGAGAAQRSVSPEPMRSTRPWPSSGGATPSTAAGLPARSRRLQMPSSSIRRTFRWMRSPIASCPR